MPAKNLISFRKGTHNQWISASTPLASGEPGYDITNNVLKIGNGTTAWSGLNHIGLTGIGNSGYLSKFNSSQGVADSLIFDNGIRVGIGTTSPISTLQVSGLVTANSGNFTNSLTVNGDQNINGSLRVDNIWLDGSTIRSFQSIDEVGDFPKDLIINPDVWDPESGHNGKTATFLGPSGQWIFSSRPYDYNINAVCEGIYASKVLVGSTLDDQVLSAPGAISLENNILTVRESTLGSPAFQAIGDSGVNIGGKTCIVNLTRMDIDPIPASLGIGTSSPRGSLDVLGDVYADGEANINGNTNINGELNIANGAVYVYENNSDYSSVLGPRGLKLFNNSIDIEVSQVDTQLRGADYASFNFLTINGASALMGSEPGPFPSMPESGDIVLFSNFENPINNGIYTLEPVLNNGSPIPFTFRAIRTTGYTNGLEIPSRFSIKITYNNTKYILNRTGTGTSIIGVDPLFFELDTGDAVLNIQDSLDVDFAQSISAKAKYFKIPHPEPNSKYQYLQYGSLESPYNGVRLTGKDKLNKGICEVRLPNYLKHLIHEEDISIQLTNKGHHKILYVDKIDLNNSSFTVKGYRSKTGGPFEFYWTFSGVRKDIDPLIVEH